MSIGLWKRGIVPGIAILSIIACGVTAPVMAATPFVHETVDAAGIKGQYTSIALDAQGNPHIIYHDGSLGRLRYAAKTASGWMVE